jgi:hypothetical protein
VGGFAWVDIDGDADEDLLAQMTYTWWYRNTGHQLEVPVALGGFANYSFNEFGPTIHDMDKDGALDFVGVSRIGSTTSPAVFFNDGAGGFGPRLALMRYRNSGDALAIGDADHNGWLDLLVKPSGHGDWYLHLMHPAMADCNANGIPDAADLDEGTSHDLDRNGIPDECGPRRIPRHRRR